MLGGSAIVSMGHKSEVPEKRPLTDAERGLIRWLLDNGTSEARQYLSQLAHLSVESRCGCGCASINFTEPFQPAGAALSDHHWRDESGHLHGVFVWAHGGVLAGLEVWSIDGASTATVLPMPSQLRPLGELK